MANTSTLSITRGEPIRHGMTVSELAKMFNSERHINAKLTVVPVKRMDAQRPVPNPPIWFGSTCRRICGI